MDKQKGKPDDPKQSECFVETAKKVQADESGKTFEKAVRAIVPKKRPPKVPPSA